MTQNNPLAQAIMPGQEYLADAAEHYGVRLIEHQRTAPTCAEKAALLVWDLSRIVKAVYFGNGHAQYGVVTPDLGKRVPIADLTCEKLSLAKKLPHGMEHGTCTPFITALHLQKPGGIERLFIHEAPELETTVIDVALAGIGEAARRRSVHLTYGALKKILTSTFPEHVTVCDVYNRKPYIQIPAR